MQFGLCEQEHLLYPQQCLNKTGAGMEIQVKAKLACTTAQIRLASFAFSPFHSTKTENNSCSLWLFTRLDPVKTYSISQICLPVDKGQNSHASSSNFAWGQNPFTQRHGLTSCQALISLPGVESSEQHHDPHLTLS